MEEIETSLQPPQLSKEKAVEEPPSKKMPTTETTTPHVSHDVSNDELETKTPASITTTLSTMTTTVAAEAEMMNEKNKEGEKKDQPSSSLTSPEKDSMKETSTTTLSPTSVMISTSFIEETYRSIDVHAVLTNSPKKKSMKKE